MILSITYRVERRWPKVSKRWASVPEHNNVTLHRATLICESGQPWCKDGMEQRVVRTTEKVIRLKKKKHHDL